MCLAVPVKVIEINGDEGTVEIENVRYTADLRLVEDVKKGDYVIVHAGFAIRKLDEIEAKETLKLLKEAEII